MNCKKKILTDFNNKYIISKKATKWSQNKEVIMGQKGSSTKQKICEVAEKLFAENGYKNVSMQDICDSSGMSKGGVYRHFSSKSELLLSLLQKEKRVFQDIQEGKSAIETLENLLNILKQELIWLRQGNT